MKNYLELGIQQHQNNNLKKAISFYLLAKKHDPKNLKIFFFLGTAYLQNADYQKSIIELTSYIKQFKNDFLAFANLGVAYTEVGNFQKAFLFFTESLKLNPKYSHTYSNFSNLYIKQNEYNMAIEFLKKAIQIERNPVFIISLANCYFKTKQINEAINTASLIEPSSEIIFLKQKYKLFIKIYSYLEDFNKALNEITNIENISSLSNEEIIKKIEILLRLNKFPEAMDIINNSKLNKKELNFIKGQYYFFQGDFSKSLSYFQMCKSNNKFTEKIEINIGEIYKSKFQYQLAIKHYNNAIKSNSNSMLAKLNKSLIDLFNFNFIDGWNNYYYRNKVLPNNFSHSLSEWKKDTLPEDPILIINEQGIGDQIILLHILLNKINNFNGYTNFHFTIDPRLLELFKFNFPNIKFINIDDFISNNNFKFYIFIGDLIKYFLKHKNDISNNLHNFTLKEKSSNFTFPKNKVLIGISWASKNNPVATQKSLKLQQFTDYLLTPHTALINLQYGDINQEFNSLLNKENIQHDFINYDFDKFNDIYQLFQLINSLDVIVTISNVTAHIAGILNKRCFLLVPKYRGRHWYWHDDHINIYYQNTEVFFYDNDNINSYLEIIRDKIIFKISS